jgi:hypothetical protein
VLVAASILVSEGPIAPGRSEPAAQAPTHTVEGTVRVLGTGDPLAGATVRGFDSRGRGIAVTTTNVDGRYLFLLSPGTFDLTAELPGDPDSRTAGTRVVLDGVVGMNHEVALGIDVPGRISGVVRDAEGNPLRLRVSLARMRYRYGRRTIETFGGRGAVATTGELGGYTVSAPAGEYYLIVSDGSGPVQYYPGVVVPETAIPLKIPANAELSGTNVTVSEVDSRRVRFSFPLPPAPENLASVVPIRALVRPLGRGQMESAPYTVNLESLGDGGYRSPPLAPGMYEFMLNYATEIRRALPNLDWNQMDPITRFRVTLAGEDVDLGPIVQGPHANIDGRVVLPENRTQEIDLGRVPGFSFVDTAFGGNVLLAVPGSDGRFRLEGVVSGQYAFGTDRLPSAWPDGWYIASVTAGGRDILGDGLDVTSVAMPPIDIVIANDGARISGVVHTPEDAPVPDAEVVLVRPAENRGPMSRVSATEAGPNGAFAFEDVPPGSYRIIALDALSVPDWMWTDLAFVEGITLAGTSVRVEPGQEVIVELDVVRRPR